jgi:hypothetical protein
MSPDPWWYEYKAWLICHEYNFAPYADLKYEEVLPTNNIGSQFYANTSNTVKVHIQYDTTKLKMPY